MAAADYRRRTPAGAAPRVHHAARLTRAALALTASLVAAATIASAQQQAARPQPARRAAPVASPTDARLTSPRANRVADSLLALMTLDEKLGQLTMTPAGWAQTGPSVSAEGEQAVREGKVGSFLSFWGAAATRKMQRIAVEESRLHIPLLFSQDVIHGWRTIFPVPLAAAGSFDSAAVAGAARIAAIEASAYGIHWTFAPMVDLARDPRWGRVVEGGGEDPLLGSVMAVAQVRGFQGDDLAAGDALLATVKHYAAYGGAEGGRDYNTVDISERTLWETYMPPYEAAVRAGAGTVMASFNEIGGTPVHASRYLLQDVLRDRWRFRGLVVSDWTGVMELMKHGLGDSATVATRALGAGVDIEMSSTLYRNHIAGQLRARRITIADVNEAVRRVLRAKHAMGLFDDPYRGTDTTRERSVTLRPEHRAASRALARKSIVLLENRANAAGVPALPLRRDLRSIAVIGPMADDARSAIGNWAGAGRAEDAITPLAGLRLALPDAQVTHVRGTPVDTVNTAGIAAAVAAARAAEAVVLVLGERQDMSAEAASRVSIELPGSQLELAQAVLRGVRATDPNKPVIAVLMNGRPLATQWLSDSMPALVESWFLGTEHGAALADILLGDANPSGRMAVTVPRATGQIPIYYNHKNTGRPANPADHYTSKYIDAPWTPLYPFGFGRSYTTFTYGALRVPANVGPGKSVTVSVEVSNTGARAGDEIVQLYVRDDAATVTRPVRELKGFQRITLAPGEKRTISFTLTPASLSFLDERMRRVVEPGTFTVWAGGHSDATLEARFRVTGETLVLAPPPPRFR